MVPLRRFLLTEVIDMMQKHADKNCKDSVYENPTFEPSISESDVLTKHILQCFECQSCHTPFLDPTRRDKHEQTQHATELGNEQATKTSGTVDDTSLFGTPDTQDSGNGDIPARDVHAFGNPT